MEDDFEALDVLINAMLSLHALRREDWQSGNNADYVGFTDEEIRNLAMSLWLDRYTDSRKSFQESVGAAVAENLGRS